MPLSSYQISPSYHSLFRFGFRGSAKGGMMMEDCGLRGMRTVHFIDLLLFAIRTVWVYLFMYGIWRGDFVMRYAKKGDICFLFLFFFLLRVRGEGD